MPFNIPFFTDASLIKIFLKSFAVLGSIIFLLYSFVLVKQTRLMTKTLIIKENIQFMRVSYAHIIVGIILLVLSILIL